MERTHDLRRLIQIASANDREFLKLMGAAVTLTPYASAYRYPIDGAVAEPDRAEFEEAFRLAEELVAFVLSRLPEDVIPN